MLTSKQATEKVLRALAERLEFVGAPSTELAVCGGAALHVLGLMTRGVTKDVDAFAIVRRAGKRISLVKADPLPEYLRREAEIVGRDFNLPKGWLNAGPADILDLGLPKGLAGRLHRVKYGKRLTVHYLDRVDQIHFKLYAAADNGPDSRHMADLVALKPKAAELEAAARWAVTHDPSPGFMNQLKGCLRHIGHDDVAERI